MSYKKGWFHQVIEKHHEKTEVCKVLKGELVKELEETGDVSRLPHTEGSLKNKGRRKDVKFQHLNICNLYVRAQRLIIIIIIIIIINLIFILRSSHTFNFHIPTSISRTVFETEVCLTLST